ncbi:sialin isoform X2 [Cephus cinctus]|uniref:Sialin isoform X2 n=1 Tax=Cephus cinctus TaxID=211228 RepID=A0AAJ7FN49_CEPCN|nr:sialin isoform X2 [Cephus cinctus]
MGVVRFLFAIMLCIANMIIYGLKVNISTAIIGMIKNQLDNQTLTHSWECPEYEASVDSTTDLDGPFEWTTTEQGLIISIYFAGYLIGMFPSGYLADRFNAKWVLLSCVLCNAIFALLVPLAASRIQILYTFRFLSGLVSSANLPVVNVLVGKWVVYEEKSTWTGIIYAGTSLGTVISILSSGLILNSLGWEAIFYTHGALPLLWCVTFALFFADNPESQKYISEEERRLLVNSYSHRSPASQSVRVPWKRIFTSRPVWALILTNTLANFSWYFLLTQLPLYMNKMLRFNIKSNAVISCLPYLINALLNPLLGKLLDLGRSRGYWNQTVARKIAVTISCLPPSIFLLIIAYIGCNRVAATALLSLSIVIGGAIFIGHLCNHNDLAPNYAGILMGITNTPGTVSAFLLPALVGKLTENGHTFAQWRYVFWVNIVALLVGWLVFVFLGSGSVQDWNYPKEEGSDKQMSNTRKTEGDEQIVES